MENRNETRPNRAAGMRQKNQHNRLLGCLKSPEPVNEKEMAYKIVIDEIRNQGVFVYLYLSPEAVRGSYDLYYPDMENALEDWQNLIDERGWIPLPEPPADAHDLIFLK